MQTQRPFTLNTRDLILRQMTPGDLDSLYAVLGDRQSMRHYPAPFTRARCEGWIQWNLDNYTAYGFGLWAVVLRANGACIGDCGLTWQRIDGETLPEIGYHIHRLHTGRGYATQAARACRDYAFDTLRLDAVYACMKYTNVSSQRVAQKAGMRLIREYADDVNTRTRVYALTRAEYAALPRAFFEIIPAP